ncbi:MAG: IS110 family transposase [Oscillospiraceae bacterium]|nr:IS110 family transposase [Oscillospiraceae bacterium]
MIYVGVDVAKNTHYACVTGDQKVITAPFSFTNDEMGFTKFQNSFAKYPAADVIVGLESTSIYGENLMAFVAELGYRIALINPIETSSIRKTRIRNSKTDKIDAKSICKYLSREEYRLMQPKELALFQLRGLCRFRQTVKKSNCRLKTQLVSYIDINFPEFGSAFCSVHLKSTYAVLSEFPTAGLIAKANITKLTNLLNSNSRGKFNREKADKLKTLAKRSIASPNRDMAFQIINTIKQIQLIELQLDDIEKRICTIFNDIDSIIKTIPGIGEINGSMILSEIGDISRFSNPNQLIAFAGLDPTVSQSGNFKAKSTRMSKRGSSVLRYALVNAAWNVSLNNDTFKSYYNEKFAQKGRHYAALGHVAGKLTRVIFKILKDNVPFNLP